jgi:transcriptional regulator with XRE-family HTH domain
MTIDHSHRARFASQLRVAIDERNVSIRALARELNPTSPETARSNLSRWLRASHMPSRTSRRSVAVALGLSPDHFEPDDDEEADLAVVLRRAVAQEVQREVARLMAREAA